MRKNIQICLLSAALICGSYPTLAASKPTYKGKMEMGQLLYFNGNIDQAIRAFKYASQLDPNAFDPHLNLVNIYVQKKDMGAAIEEAREGLKLKPKHRDLHLILGNLLRTEAGNKTGEEQQKMLDEAAAELHVAEELGASKAMVNSTLAVVHVQRGDFDKALEHCDKAIDAKQEMPDAHLIRGILKFKKGDKETAVKELDLAIKQKGKNAEARNTKADILFADGKVDQAMEEYKRALKDDEKYHQSMVGVANILIKNQKWEEALAQLEKAQEIKPEDANITYSIAICLEKLGKTDPAIQKFNEGIMMDNNPTTKTQIQAHVRDLQKANFLNVPGLGAVGGGGLGPGMSQPVGSGLFSVGSSFYNESFKDMIKIKAPGEKEEKEAKPKK